MAKSKDKTPDDGFIHRSSSEQAEVNRENATTPAGLDKLDANAGEVVLNAHSGDAGVVTDADGRVVSVHTTTVITDPESPLAVQVPDPDVYPGANGTKLDARAVNAEPTPNEVAAGEGEPTVKAESSDSDKD